MLKKILIGMLIALMLTIGNAFWQRHQEYERMESSLHEFESTFLIDWELSRQHTSYNPFYPINDLLSDVLAVYEFSDGFQPSQALIHTTFDREGAAWEGGGSLNENDDVKYSFSCGEYYAVEVKIYQSAVTARIYGEPKYGFYGAPVIYPIPEECFS